MRNKLYQSIVLFLLCLPLVGLAATINVTGSVKIKGNLTVVGTLTKTSGTFAIDHPLDPANKILYHSFVESNAPENLYDGTATLDSKGEVTIVLPAYWDALNKDARYQFFALEQPMPNLYIKQEEKNNQFSIGGGAPGGTVSWQVTGTRHDPYILAHPQPVEVEKGPTQSVPKGECIFEPLCK